MRTCYNFQTDLVLIKMGLYWPNFSLMFIIHLFLYAGVYCMTQTVGLSDDAVKGDDDDDTLTFLRTVTTRSGKAVQVRYFS